MRSVLTRAAGSRTGGPLLAMTLFVVLFMLVGENTPMTLSLAALGISSLLILVQPQYGLFLLVVNAVGGLSAFFDLPRVGPLAMPLVIEGVLLLAFVVHVSFYRKVLYLNIAMNWLLLGYMLLALFSILMARHVGPENFLVFRRLFVLVILLYFLLINIVENRAMLLQMQTILLLSGAVVVILSTMISLGLMSSGVKENPLEISRAVGTLGNANNLAFTLISLVPFVVIAIVQSRRVWKRLLLVGLAIGNLYVILSTLSRGGFIALLAMALFLTFRFSKDRRLMVILLLFGLITYLLLPAALFERFDEVRSLQGNSRYVLTMIGFRMAAANPVLGVGYGNFRRNFHRYDVYGRGGATAPHNAYTSIAAQAGFPALFLFLLCMFLALLRQGHLTDLFKKKQDRRLMLLMIALQGSLVGMLVFFLSGNMEGSDLVYIVLGMTVIAERLSRSARFAPSLQEPGGSGLKAGLDSRAPA